MLLTLCFVLFVIKAQPAWVPSQDPGIFPHRTLRCLVRLLDVTPGCLLDVMQGHPSHELCTPE